MQNYVHNRAGMEIRQHLWWSWTLKGKEEREEEGQEILLCKQERSLHTLIAAWTTSSITVRISPGGDYGHIGWRYKTAVRFAHKVQYGARISQKSVDQARWKLPVILIVWVARSISRLFVGGRIVISRGDEHMIMQFCSMGGNAADSVIGVNKNYVLFTSETAPVSFKW